jgi:phospho-N-acetylmuramoyl-pentapeptide-transferase
MMQSSMAVALAGFSFMLTVIWGPPLIRVLRYFKIGKAIRVEGPERHFTKLGTPTMGGVMFILPVLLITVLMNAGSLLGITLLGRSVIVPMVTLALFAGLGAVDDWLGLRVERQARGLSGRTKLIFQTIFSLLIALALEFVLDAPDMFLPGIPLELSLGVWYVPVATFIIVAMSNAINLTDGLDGLAGLISATAFATYGGIALLQGQVFLGRFCFTLVGAIFGFLWFNVHPAMLIMGDTGSLSLGATLAVVALMTGQWMLIPLIAVIPVSVVLSVALQVIYHFELSGWSETQVVQRFWLITLLFAMVGVALALV